MNLIIKIILNNKLQIFLNKSIKNNNNLYLLEILTLTLHLIFELYYKNVKKIGSPICLSLTKD